MWWLLTDIKFNYTPLGNWFLFASTGYTHFFYKNKVYKNIRLRFAQILGAKNFKNHVGGSKKVSKSS